MRRLLVIEDDDDTRAALCTLLIHSHFNVTTARNGAEGLCQVQAYPPKLILLDLFMPGMDGFEFMRRLKEMPEANIPVAVLSAASNLPEGTLALPIVFFAPKTLDPPVLVALCEKYCAV